MLGIMDTTKPESLRNAEIQGQRKLREYCRADVGIQANMSRRTGISPGSLSQMSRGKKPVTLEAAMLIEIDTDGALLAAELCPSKAELFAKFKARG